MVTEYAPNPNHRVQLKDINEKESIIFSLLEDSVMVNYRFTKDVDRSPDEPTLGILAVIDDSGKATKSIRQFELKGSFYPSDENSGGMSLDGELVAGARMVWRSSESAVSGMADEHISGGIILNPSIETTPRLELVED
jgi:hypothetical protein